VSVELRVTAYDDPVVRELENRVQAEYVVRYGGPDASAIDGTQFEPPGGLFLVAWDGGGPVACGGFRLHDERTVEVKRMYVPPEHRGHGYARAVLAGLESRARDAGYAQVILETGDAQPEAIALYESTGYVPVEPFGHYRDSPRSRSFGKRL
jgi:GNAT superfamily N-acetyltransferase